MKSVLFLLKITNMKYLKRFTGILLRQAALIHIGFNSQKTAAITILELNFKGKENLFMISTKTSTKYSFQERRERNLRTK